MLLVAATCFVYFLAINKLIHLKNRKLPLNNNTSPKNPKIQIGEPPPVPSAFINASGFILVKAL